MCVSDVLCVSWLAARFQLLLFILFSISKNEVTRTRSNDSLWIISMFSVYLCFMPLIRLHNWSDDMEQLKNMAVSIQSHKNRSRDVIDSLDILFNENEEVEEIATTIVIIKGKITDLEEIIERVSTLVNKLGIE